MDWVGIVVQLIAGVVGGVGTGKAVKAVDLGNIGNVISGAIGGVGGTWLASMIPGIQGMLTSAAGGGYGNYNAHLGKLLINGVEKSADSFLFNVKKFTASNVFLDKDQTIDVYIGRNLGGGNTQTVLEINGVQAVPEPASMAALAMGALAVAKRRKRA